MNRKVNNTNYNQNRNILFQVPKTEMTLNAIPTSQSINLGMSQINPIISGNNALYNQYRNDTVRSPERKVYSPTQISPNYRSQNIIPTKYLTTSYLPSKVVTKNQQYSYNTYATVVPMKSNYSSKNVITNTNIIHEPQEFYRPKSNPISTPIDNISYTSQEYIRNDYQPLTQMQIETQNFNYDLNNIAINELVEIPQTNTYIENIITTTDNKETEEFVASSEDEIEGTNNETFYDIGTQNKNKNYYLNSPAKVTPIQPIETEEIIHQYIHNSPVIQKKVDIFSPIQSPLSNFETQSYNPDKTIYRLEAELASLRAENEIFRKQILELNRIRVKAEETRLLKEQVEQLSPLKSQVEEMISMKSQFSELNDLRKKVKELEQLRAEVEKINAEKNKKLKTSGIKEKKVKKIRKTKKEEKDKKSGKKEANKNTEINTRINREELKYKKSEKQLEENKEETKIMEQEEKTGQNIVKGEIVHNLEELEMLISNINISSNKMALNLIYKASADSDRAIDFHKKCDEAKSTIVLIETDKGKRFGGYTSVSWKGNCKEKIDEDAFIFSLDKMKTYDIIPGKKAIGCYPKFGPVFLGCQIKINDNAFKRGGTTFKKGINYKTKADFELTDGDREFNVKDVEVYEVIPH